MRPAVAEQLAQFVVGLELTRVPHGVIERARLCLLDGLGAIVAGSTTETGQIARSLLAEVGGPPQATVLGAASVQAAVPWAALANGMQAHALEVDDGHRYAIGLHNAATTLPAALALAERQECSGADLLAALIAGYQVAGRIGTAINPGHRYLAFHSTGTVGPFGATAAAARLLRLDVEQTARALGIAGSLAGGIFEFLADGSTVKHLHGGAAAQHGVLAALLAQRGLTGPKTVLEGPEGFLKAFARDGDKTAMVEAIRDDLASRWELDHAYFKLHAACAHCFAPIDAALALRDQLAGQAVRRVEVRSYRAAAVLDHQIVHTRQEAKFSVPYCVAAALTLGHAAEPAFGPEARADPRIISLAQQVVVVESPELTRDFPRTRAAELRLELDGGAILEHRVDVPRGMPDNPAPPAELVLKFRTLVASALGTEAADQLVDAVRDVERSSAAELARLAAKRADRTAISA